MEKQRSFSFKSTKCLMFYITVSFSIFLLSFLFFWVMKDATSEMVNFESVNPKPLVEFGSNLSVHDVRSANLMQTLFRKPQNTSGFDRDLDLQETQMRKDEEEEEEEEEEEAMDAEKEVDLVEYDVEVEVKHVEIDGNVTEKGEGYSGNSSYVSIETEIPSVEKIVVNSSKRFCDVSVGRWVFDESYYPLYSNFSCPFIDEGFNCKGNGRLDSDFMKWRWQPQDCDIPRFNATKMLEMIRGKKLVFVGDSINRNQWESMLCMLMSAVKDPKKVYETHGRRITKEKGSYSFRFVDYQCTVEFYVTHFLVHETAARVGKKRVPTLRIDSIDRGSSRWRGADILIFNTANWWSHSKTKAGSNYYQEGKIVHPHMDVLTAFRRALRTWATWVDRHVNRRRTRVFFRSAAPSHFRGGEWNSGGHCGEANRPLSTSNIAEPEKDRIAREVIKNMKTQVTFLNVTSLSGYRIDGHPSIYGSKSRRRFQDCSHWCLPGVPDAWNELLYYHMLLGQQTESYSR